MKNILNQRTFFLHIGIVFPDKKFLDLGSLESIPTFHAQYDKKKIKIVVKLENLTLVVV